MSQHRHGQRAHAWNVIQMLAGYHLQEFQSFSIFHVYNTYVYVM